MADRDAEVKARAEARVGDTLRDKWHIDGLIGLGGMAAVYEATHRNGKRAAIKILHAEAAMVPDIRARFLREGYLANRVGHSGAVSILDDDVDVDGTVYLVMELLEGQTLDSFRGANRIACEELLLIAFAVLDVLKAAHKKDIVHRDLKPANIFLCTSSAVKILDFGIARLQSVAHSQTPSGATGRDVTLGTPGYMPPEQARGHWDKVDGQSDIWSLGATLFALLSGRLVHEGATVNEQLLAAMTLPAPPLASVAPHLPAQVMTLCDCALAFDKEHRWSNAGAMQDEVARVYELLTGKSVERAPPVSVARRPRNAAPDAPTLAASEHGVTRTMSRSTRRQREIVVIAGVGIGLAITTALVLVRSGGAPEHERAASVEPRSAIPATRPSAPPATLPGPAALVPSAVPAASTLGAEPPDAGAKFPSRPPQSAKPSPRASAPTSPDAGPGEPDIFIRRK